MTANQLTFSLLASLLFACSSTGMAQSTTLPPENWCIQKLVDQNGNDVFITSNLGYRAFSKKADFPWCLEINITTVHHYPNGHPTHEEAPLLNETEDIITTALQQSGVIHYIGRATVKGYRELYYYVADPKKINAILQKLTRHPQPREWEYRMREDKHWQRVTLFLSDNATCL